MGHASTRRIRSNATPSPNYLGLRRKLGRQQFNSCRQDAIDSASRHQYLDPHLTLNALSFNGEI
eukprot:scaffold99617_cov28-Prasinocladus_malaysianus.AAC.1